MNPILLRSLRWVATGVVGLVLLFSFALACTYVYLAPALPSAENMHRMPLAVGVRIYAGSGELISQIGEQRRIPVEFDDIPDLVWQAVLAAEDDRFFQHSGFEWRGIVRALVKNAVTADAGQGGSTITQQAARNLFLTLDKTMRRKLSEVFLTWRMEQDFTKEQILATYLNVIFFGQRAHGIAAAAETYYGKRLNELTVSQAATLAGIIQRPSDQNPITNPKLAEGRRAYVLRRMRELGFIDSSTAEAAAKEPVATRGFGPRIEVEAHYVADRALQELVSRFGQASVNQGYKVFTTIDARLQTAANRAVRVGLINFDRQRGYRGALGKVEVPAAPNGDELDALLREYPTVSVLEPAVVLRVAETSADVHVRGRGTARIGWEGISWAGKALSNGKGATPKSAGEVLKRGDVVHVLADGRGRAVLAQVPAAQSALVAIDPKSGAIVSMTGGFDFFTNQFNRVTQANRQPGSGFKPFLYSAALDNGFTPASVIQDAPIVMDVGEENWRPENSSRDFRGPMRLREALVLSRNTVSIRILNDLGVDTFIEHAARFGFDPKAMPHTLTLALGSLTTTPLQMARGFSVFANGGFLVEPYLIQRIEDATGEVVYEAAPRIACEPCEQLTAGTSAPEAAPGGFDDVATVTVGSEEPDAYGTELGGTPSLAALGALAGFSPAVLEAAVNLDALQNPATPMPLGLDDVPPSMRELSAIQGGTGFLPQEQLAPRVLSPQNAWLMSDILHDATISGTARRSRSMGRDDLAGKTGTSNDGRDNWFNGFTRDLVATVWVGHDDYQPLGRGAEGSTTALPIWMLYMDEALKGTPSSRPPRPATGLIDLRVSSFWGTLARSCDNEAIVDTFMVQTLPRAPGPGEGECLMPGEDGGAGSRREPIF